MYVSAGSFFSVKCMVLVMNEARGRPIQHYHGVVISVSDTPLVSSTPFGPLFV